MTSTHNKEWRWIKKISRSWCCDRLLPLATKVNKDEHLKYPVGHEFWGWFVGINPRSSAKPIFRISSICTGKTKNQQTLKSMKYCSTPKKKVRFWWNQWMRFIDSTYFFLFAALSRKQSAPTTGRQNLDPRLVNHGEALWNMVNVNWLNKSI